MSEGDNAEKVGVLRTPVTLALHSILKTLFYTTLNGESLGSWVDEERS